MNYVSIIEHVLLMLQRFLQWWIHQGLQDRFKKTETDVLVKTIILPLQIS